MRDRLLAQLGPRDRSSFLLATVIVALLAGCGDLTGRPPNVVLYVIDTLRADGLGAYGGAKATTPHIDEFARQGVVFEQVWASSSWTRASMASILTGRHPWNHATAGRADRLPEDLTTLAAIFSERGYATALVSANPNVGSVFGFDRTFDATFELFTRSQPGVVRGAELVATSEQVGGDAIGWIEAAPRPFLLVVLSIDPHSPYTPPRRFDPALERPGTRVTGLPASINRKDLSQRDKARIRELYRAEITYNDHSFGAVLKALDEQGLRNDTLVILTSDHGEEFWEHGRRGHGRALTEELLRVPLAIRHPMNPRVPAGGRIVHPGQSVDILPTILDLVRVPVPDGVDGRSLLGTPRTPDEPLLAGLELDGIEMLTARDSRWKLVWDVRQSQLQLYDLQTDPGERTAVDVTRDPLARAAQQRLRDALETDIREGRQRRPERSQAGPLPQNVEESLRALGYIE
ncbi:MAG: sulfatase [Deltaproteobacteria bacterium]|nr:sulfatase [Deltaproteobacteria bacterium]MBW2694980.1 sulfatase [Deltaproteobacteria bacterium]